jgi:2-dehydro-3-deoxygalactonokinase
MSHNGNLLKKKESSMGLLHVQETNDSQDKFAVVLKEILESWLPNYQDLPIFMAGMIGSANGWHIVDYVQTNTTITKLIDKTFTFKLPWNISAFIVPGISHHNPKTGCHDVMRGEEIQVFGLIDKCQQQKLSIVLPGTHS